MSYSTNGLATSIVVGEKDHQEREEGENPHATRHFVVTGTDNGGDAYAALMTYLATNFDDGADGIATYDIPLKSVRMNKEDGAPVFNAECQFEFPQNSEASNDVNDSGYETPEVENCDYQFSATGGTSHITHSMRTLHKIPKEGETARDFNGGIGLNNDGTFEGVDVVTPRCSFTISQSFPQEWFSSNYRRTLAAAIGCVNSAPFDGFPAGCVQFKSVDAKPTWFSYTDRSTGNMRKDWYWRASFKFDVMPNATLTFGGQTFVKRGFDYLWKLTEKTEDAAGNTTADVVQVNVEQVYNSFDFAALCLPIPE